jgi:hypothetical protein
MTESLKEAHRAAVNPSNGIAKAARKALKL